MKKKKSTSITPCYAVGGCGGSAWHAVTWPIMSHSSPKRQITVKYIAAVAHSSMSAAIGCGSSGNGGNGGGGLAQRTLGAICVCRTRKIIVPPIIQSVDKMFKIFLTLCNPARSTRALGPINFRLTEYAIIVFSASILQLLSGRSL